MPDDISAIDPLLPHPVDDEETDRITLKFAAQLAGDSLDASPDGLKIDRYINAEVRARGGMGRVFVAYDPGLDRTVALKALPVGLLPHEPGADTPRREGMALAHIDHPNVVRVLELIEHRGLACLVLEHVDGPHLGDWLKAPRDFRDILHKFLQAGEGLAAVHRAGLVHRDFKPANAVVGPGGVVKLIDFGLAFRPATRRPDDLDDRPGTPRYMAPEQIDGREVDARSDQFSFCVALYEALFRAHPYLSSDDTPSADQHANPFDADAEQASRATIFDQILEGTPRRPERIPPGLPPTVVTALLRGLSPKPEDRHATMDALLAELRRDPRRRRRRAFFALAGVVGFATGLYTALRPIPCHSPEDQASQTWGRLRDEVETRLAPFGDHPLEDLKRAVSQLADAQVKACQNRGKRPEIDFPRDVCLQIQEHSLRALLYQVTKSNSAQITELTKNLKELPSVNICDDVARLRFSCLKDGTSEYAQAESKAALLTGDGARALERAEAALMKAEASGAVGSRANAHILLGRIAYMRGDRPRALYHLTEAIDLAERNACFDPAAEAYHWFVKLAAFDEQIPLLRAEISSQYHEYRLLDDDFLGRAAMLNNRALLAERRRRDFSLAERLLRTAIALRQGSLESLDAQADSYLNLSSVLINREKYDEALAELNIADYLRKLAVGAKHPDHAKHLRNRGLIELALGRHQPALALLKEALTLASAGLGEDAPILGEIHTAIAHVYNLTNNPKAALESAEAALRASSDDLQRSESLEDVAQLLIAAKRYAEAIPRLDEAENLIGSRNVSLERRATFEFKRGEALNGLELFDDAERHARQAHVYLDEASVAFDHPKRGYAALILGEALVGQERWREAAHPFEQAIAIWQDRGENYKEVLAWAWWGLAKSLCRLPDRRLDAQEAAREARRSIPVIDPSGNQHAWEQELAAICQLR